MFGIIMLACWLSLPQEQMEWIRVAPDGASFLHVGSNRPFIPWGFNYDHDDSGRLLEDYWDKEWSTVEMDFAEMRQLGANVIRIHLQLGRFMRSEKQPNDEALARLEKLLKLAERERLYLDITGLGCYHKRDVPAWYDALDELGRWAVQACFWEAIAKRCADSPAVFCFDLMNEPVVPGGKRQAGEWLGGAFAGKHFVQFITLDQASRPRPEIARQWACLLARAIRKHDTKHLITIGLVDWSLDRKGLTSGFVPTKVAEAVDFISVHIYPERGKIAEALETLAGFSIGKPVVIEEIFPLKCSISELDQFIKQSKPHAAGWIGFYWGKSPAELRRDKSIASAILLSWLEFFEQQTRGMKK